MTDHSHGPRDALARQSVADGADPRISRILEEVCELIDMGFVALARVTEERWIACQLIDRIEFGLQPGDELEIKTTICNEIRGSGSTIIIDHVAADQDWRTHHTPMLYGFESYASIPLFLKDGSFYGTLCAIDPGPRRLSAPETVAALQSCAGRVAAILSERADLSSAS